MQMRNRALSSELARGVLRAVFAVYIRHFGLVYRAVECVATADERSALMQVMNQSTSSTTSTNTGNTSTSTSGSTAPVAPPPSLSRLLYRQPSFDHAHNQQAFIEATSRFASFFVNWLMRKFQALCTSDAKNVRSRACTCLFVRFFFEPNDRLLFN